VKLAQLLKEAGMPDGVFNVVQGDKEAVDVLLTDSRVQAVSFVGLTPIAEYIYQTASANGKRCQALGGVKNHYILMQDANMGMAANAIMGAAYGAAGERCMALSVVLAVTNEIATELCSRLEVQIAKLRIGPGFGHEPENEMGPLISAPYRAKVLGYIDDGEKQGATLRVDSRRLKLVGNEEGYLLVQRCWITSYLRWLSTRKRSLARCSA